MSSDSPKPPAAPGRGPDAERREAERRERAAAALRENLKKRKAQARGRKEAAAPRDEGGGEGG
ncbi:hypothetical protein [Methylopila turkensis]|uniref:Uncharacterized protein n=1 Tax=Methylopila turkensis TaxID=1437816 RepID=A0A9W6JMB1_9HYPH|nr:hypothetical protein [Methylopila turkensis]GLK79717.1 hypothetical protein GCM10008174_14580 [Methylopila turkensis]